jgi:hypothetical protein
MLKRKLVPTVDITVGLAMTTPKEVYRRMIRNQCSQLLWLFVLYIAELHVKFAEIWFWVGNAMQGGGESYQYFVPDPSRQVQGSSCVLLPGNFGSSGGNEAGMLTSFRWLGTLRVEIVATKFGYVHGPGVQQN